MHFHGHNHSDQESQVLGFCREGMIDGADFVWTLLYKTRCWQNGKAGSEGEDLASLSEVLTAKKECQVGIK